MLNSRLINEAEAIVVIIPNFKRMPTSYHRYYTQKNRSKVEIIFYLPNFFIFLNKNRAYIWVLSKRFFPENLKFLLLFVRP